MDLLQRRHYIGPMIVVAPTASTSFFADDECLDTTGRVKLEHYLAFTVVDAIDHTFRTLRARNERAIGGMSSGGFCALNIGLHHLHRFSVILASEPYGDPGRGPLYRLLGGSWALWRANSPSFYLPHWRFPVPVATFLDSGARDRATTAAALEIARDLSARGQSSAYRAAAGQYHTWRAAHAELPYALIFAWHHFGRWRSGSSDRADAAEFQRVLRYAETLPPPSRPTSPPTPGPSSPVPVPPPMPQVTAPPSSTSSPRPSQSAQPSASSIVATRRTSAAVSRASQRRMSGSSNQRAGP
jgi:hypothetical protein